MKVPNYVLASVISDVIKERINQEVKHGESNKNNTSEEWLAIVTEEVGEVAQAINSSKPWGKPTDPDNLYEEVIQSAASLIQWAEHLINLPNDE